MGVYLSTVKDQHTKINEKMYYSLNEWWGGGLKIFLRIFGPYISVT